MRALHSTHHSSSGFRSPLVPHFKGHWRGALAFCPLCPSISPVHLNACSQVTPHPPALAASCSHPQAPPVCQVDFTWVGPPEQVDVQAVKCSLEGLQMRLVVVHQGPQQKAGEAQDPHHRIQGLDVPPGKGHHKQRRGELYGQLLQGRMTKASFHSRLWSASSGSRVWARTPVLLNLIWNESWGDVRDQGKGWGFFSGQETWETLLSLHPRGTQGRVRDILWLQSHSFGPTGTRTSISPGSNKVTR